MFERPESGLSHPDPLLCGPGGLPEEPVRLRAGALELLFEKETGSIRRIRCGDHEIIRGVYGAVRDRNWGTVQPSIQNIRLRHLDEQGFEIMFTAQCKTDEIAYLWHGSITGDSRQICFEFLGEALSDFLGNRIGLCVLHPILECAGQPCLVEHSNGTVDASAFPRLISPVQPFYEMAAIRHTVGGLSVEVRFEGEIFEMEDQRNWTDWSFKSYAPPLDRPFPVLVRRGAQARQAVKIRWEGEMGQRPLASTEEICVRVNWSRLRSKPPLGVGVASERSRLTENDIRRLSALRLGHLRVDCRLWEHDWVTWLQEADAQASALNCGLHIAVFLSGDDAESELRKLRLACARLIAPVRVWLIFHRTEESTSPEWVEIARRVLTGVAPSAEFAAGSNVNFAELNRGRPPVDADWLSCFPMNPQVHAEDLLTLVENISAQVDTLDTAQSFSKQPIVISPVTLLPRCNPDATEHDTSQRSMPPADPRQSSLFVAGWTLGSLAALMPAASVHSLTYYETVGPRGLASGNGMVFPVYHIFRSLAELKMLCDAQLTRFAARLEIAALAGINPEGTGVLWLANLTPRSRTVLLEMSGEVREFSVKRIDEANVASVSENPAEWWRASGVESAGESIKLPRYSVARLETRLRERRR